MLVDLTYRSNEEELMDDPDIDNRDLTIALQDISRVNKLLGGNTITVNAVFNQIKNRSKQKEWRVMDLGCGDGEMLRQIADSARKKGVSIKLIGIDNNYRCIAQAKKLSDAYPEISYHNKDILTLTKQDFGCHIIISTLTLHHFKDKEIIKVLQKGIELVSEVIIINDIHRNILTYYLYKLFSFFFINGYIAKNDGLISIKRGFKRKELICFADELKLKRYTLDWKWAFRYRWIINSK